MTRDQFVHRTIDRLIAQGRDGLGRAHYERMRAGMHPDVQIAAWEELTESVREAYRSKLDYLLPVLTGMVGGLVIQASEHDCRARSLADLS